MGVWTAVTSVLGIAGDWIASKREEKRVEAEGRVRIRQARVEAEIEDIADRREHDQGWENASRDKVWWADDVLTAWTVGLMTAAFIPPAVPYVRDGLDVLESYPDWLLAVVGIVWASAFGVKKLGDLWQQVKRR